MSRFIQLNNKEKLCPRCGSLSRTRRLWSILEGRLQNKNVLHFSPHTTLAKRIGNQNTREYVTTDYCGEFDSKKQLDIESINEPDNHYDLIICYHILEHVENDIGAMKELKRILKPEGICIIQTPFKKGDIYENEEIKSKGERRKHFGQEDHLRIYSVRGLLDRLIKAGFRAKATIYEEEINNTHGYKSKETVIFAEKLN